MATTVLGALSLLAAACGGSSSSSPTTAVSLNSGLQALNPGTGTPQRGGTLNLLGTGDVDFMDYNISYYTIGALAQRLYQRGLYGYPAQPGHTTDVVPDLATAMPVISNGGKTYSLTIRNGADWNTSPARQVTAADALRGLERSCNPVQPFGGLPDFEGIIVGYADFCNGFAALGATATAAKIKTYMDTHSISGVTVSGQTITYNLTQPASYFTDELQLDAFSPAPVESLAYVPGSADSQQHVIADGPYRVSSYVPTKSITFTRNPAWQQSSDPIRHAYVNQINVNETGDQTTNQTELQTNTAAAGAEWDSFVPVAAVTGLVAQMQHGSKNFNLGPQFATNPYIVFNTVSPNNGGALGKVEVRQALSYAINRAHLIQDANGATLSPPLTHVLPDGIDGSQDVPKGYDPYPYDPTKAKSMLKAAGYPNGFTLKFLYRPSSSLSTKMFQTLQADLAQVGVKLVGVGVPAADFLTKYLIVPSVAKAGTWDVSLAGWGPDWYGDAATSFFKPLFYGAKAYPPVGSNFGFYNNPAVNSLITKAASQGSASAAASYWAQLDQMVMKDAPIYPITQPLLPLYHASYVHNAVYVPALEEFDYSNVWLSKPTG
ncbi:MAG TPA: ABC transporter substrate-binding protein [Streptosporangiaceae bacterium]|nr:ABC transporter substrate-binding protein [Streptosporangiaceae bacterium]